MIWKQKGTQYRGAIFQLFSSQTSCWECATRDVQGLPPPPRFRQYVCTSFSLQMDGATGTRIQLHARLADSVEKSCVSRRFKQIETQITCSGASDDITVVICYITFVIFYIKCVICFDCPSAGHTPATRDSAPAPDPHVLKTAPLPQGVSNQPMTHTSSRLPFCKAHPCTMGVDKLCNNENNFRKI